MLLQGLGISKKLSAANHSLQILKSISVQVKSGDSLCVTGSSGAGKSTLLHILGTLDRPSSGELLFEGEDLLKMSDADLAHFRNRTMGFVFQFHHLLPDFSAVENVMIPCRIGGAPISNARRRAEELLEIVGLGARAQHFPNQLSGGELQRVAIARALAQKPRILFADEPTGNLDSQNSSQVQNLFFQLKESQGLTLVVVTHDLQFSKRFGKVLRLADGQWASN